MVFNQPVMLRLVPDLTSKREFHVDFRRSWYPNRCDLARFQLILERHFQAPYDLGSIDRADWRFLQKVEAGKFLMYGIFKVLHEGHSPELYQEDCGIFST